MTTKLKERIVTLSRNKKVEKVCNIYCLIFIIELIVHYFFKNMTILTLVMGGIFVLIVLIDIAFNAIREHKDDVLNNNKLIYIVLSNKDAVAHYIMYMGFIPIVFILSNLIGIELNLITGSIYIVVGLLILSKLSKIISDYFKNKLLK